MSIKALDDVTGAQTSGAISAAPQRTTTLSRGEVFLVEVLLTGTIAAITTALQISTDNSNWIQLAIGAAGDARVSGETAAPYMRVVTTGTGGPYDADVLIGRT